MPEEKFEELTRVYTIPLARRVLISPRQKRAKKAVSVIKMFAAKNMKSRDVKISPELNLLLWSRGIRSPPRHVTVKMERGEDGLVTVSPFKEEVQEEQAPVKEEVSAEEAVQEEKVSAKEEESAEESGVEEVSSKGKEVSAEGSEKAEPVTV